MLEGINEKKEVSLKKERKKDGPNLRSLARICSFLLFFFAIGMCQTALDAMIA